MKKIHSRLASMLVAAATISTLAGCGSHSDKIEITIGMWPQAGLTQEVNMFKVWKERFETDHPEYQIKAAPYEYSIETAQSKGQSHTLPTVFQTWFTEPQWLVNAGYIKDITSFLNDLGWYDKMDVDMRNNLTFEGKVYGIPRDGYGLGLVLNKRILGECGLLPENEDETYSIYNKDGSPAYPTTFDEVRHFSEVIVDSTDNTRGILIPSANKNGGWQFSNIAWNFGAQLEVQNSDGKWVGTLNDPKAVEAMNWIKEMKSDGLLIDTITVSYNDWYGKIKSQVGMAIVGSDVVQLAITNAKLAKEDLAFVPMPAGPYGDRYSLYGGTPYVFSSDASDEQVKGAMMFLEYMGRSPDATEANLAAVTEGNEVASKKGEPIIPSVKPWTDATYLAATKEIEDKYVNVDMTNFNDFFNTLPTMKHNEVSYYAQEMYKLLDNVIQKVLQNPDTVNVENELTTANNTFNSQYMSQL